MSESPLPTSPNPAAQSTNSWVKKLSIMIPDTRLSRFTISVLRRIVAGRTKKDNYWDFILFWLESGSARVKDLRRGFVSANGLVRFHYCLLSDSSLRGECGSVNVTILVGGSCPSHFLSVLGRVHFQFLSKT